MSNMDSTPSNGSGVRARSRKASTSSSAAPNSVKGTNGVHTATKAKTRTGPRAAQRGNLPRFDVYPAIAIENVEPEIDGGRWPIKRVVGETIDVAADIFKEGHD